MEVSTNLNTPVSYRIQNYPQFREFTTFLYSESKFRVMKKKKKVLGRGINFYPKLVRVSLSTSLIAKVYFACEREES